MPTFELKYGHGTVRADVPDARLLGILEPRRAGQPPTETSLLRDALARPTGSPRLRHLARPGQRVAIITSDLTRPCPSDRLLPPVLEELAAAGVPDSDVTVVVALGLHRAMTQSELEATVGPDICRRVRVINHNPEETVRLGITSAGTPVAQLLPRRMADPPGWSVRTARRLGPDAAG